MLQGAHLVEEAMPLPSWIAGPLRLVLRCLRSSCPRICAHSAAHCHVLEEVSSINHRIQCFCLSLAHGCD